jgi:hypothetical protein
MSTGAFAAEHYDVSVRISDGGQDFAAPRLVARPGQAATVEVSGQDAYALTVVVEPLPDGTLRTSTDLRSARGSMAPVLILKPGVPASVAVGGLSMTLTAAPGGA